ncbi:hypothetical protein Tco_0578782 [Tanacetum coccineum]
MEAFDDPGEEFDTLMGLRDDVRVENVKLIGLNEQVAHAEEEIEMKEAHLEVDYCVWFVRFEELDMYVTAGSLEKGQTILCKRTEAIEWLGEHVYFSYKENEVFQDIQLIQKLLDDEKCMKKFKPSSRSKATEDIISIGSFMEVLVLNHYVLVRKILGKLSKLQDEDA